MRITVKIGGLIVFVVFTLGCDSQPEPPAAPTVITQKIAGGAPVQQAPQKPAPQATTDPGPRSAPIQQSAAPAGAASSDSAPEKPQRAIEKQTAAARPAPAAAQAKSAVASGPKPEIESPSPLARTEPQKTTAAKPDPSKKPETSTEASEPDADAKASETDLKKLVADAAGGYSPAGKVDPFLPLFEEKPAAPEESTDAAKQKKKRRMPLTPLERVDLSQLKLVGIIQAPSGDKALVEESSGKGYIIKKGTFIGIHAGRVLEIQKDRVVVEEEVENVLGQFTLEKKELKLQKPPGEF